MIGVKIKIFYKLKKYNLNLGIPTGKCINSTEKKDTNVCELSSWCPIERDYIKSVIFLSPIIE